MAFEKDPNEIGSLWRREGAKGEYMTAEIGGQQVVCFRVRSNNPKAPTWRVLKSKPRTERPAPAMDDFPPADDDLGF